MGSCPGLEDKIYWREVGKFNFCAFVKSRGSGYVSLCGRLRRDRSGGQASRRPEPILRCAICDGREMARRGWDESGPTLEPRLPASQTMSRPEA